jgi:hypothetical protein
MRTLNALIAVVLLAGVATAQQPAAARPHGTLNQVMKGILFPNSNVIFDTQDQDPAKPDKELPSAEVFSSTYGGWQAVENAAVALGEGANLIAVAGRVCENGKPVPLGDPEFQKALQGLRDVSAVALKAAQAKNKDAMVDVSDKLSSACAACHDAYRDKIVNGKPAGMAARCTK